MVDIDGLEGIGDDEEGNAGCQLNHVVEHQVDEKDIAWVRLEDLNCTNLELECSKTQIPNSFKAESISPLID